MFTDIARIEYETTDIDFDSIREKYNIDKTLDDLGWKKQIVEQEFNQLVELKKIEDQTKEDKDKIALLEEAILNKSIDLLENGIDLSPRDLKDLLSIAKMLKGENTSSINITINSLIQHLEDDV